ncbi:MAG TPA: hypothetical protein VK203_17485 [Nostocaceae cyanobacterium]|nr:hypothetical protein [Nostocaceae cyanobacterium]
MTLAKNRADRVMLYNISWQQFENLGSTAPLMVNNINLIFVGWVEERNPTFPGICRVSLRSSQPTKYCFT